jgi:O-antigen/teichoic acid export membrane protein
LLRIQEGGKVIRSLGSKLRSGGFFHLLATNILVQLMGFGSTLAVAKLVTPDELGNIKLLQSYTGLIAVLAGCGLTTAVLKYCSEERSESEKRAIFRQAMRLAMMATILSLLAGLAMAASGFPASARGLGYWLAVYALAVPLNVATGLAITYLQSQRKLRELAKAQISMRILSFLCVLAATWAWGYAGFILSSIASLAIALVPLMIGAREGRASSPAGRLPPGFYRVSGFSLFAGLVGTFGQYADIFVLDSFRVDRASLGYYSLATVFTMASMQAVNSVQQFLSPYFCRRSTDKEWFRKNVIKAQAGTSALSILLAILSMGLAYAIVHLAFGPQYRPTLGFLGVLLIRFVIWSGYAILGGVAAFAVGKVWIDLVRNVVSVAIGTLCACILLPRMGMIGAAWGQVCGSAAALVFSLATVKAVFGIRVGTGDAGQAGGRGLFMAPGSAKA